MLNETCNPMDEDTSYGGHGTHVAGIMGAEGNNGVGVAGMNWQTTILPVRWLNNGGTLSPTSDLVKALLWLVGAKQEGVNVRVVNDSDVIEGNTGSTQLENAIETLGANNILFVTAAGNTGKNNDEVERYPCKYDKPTEICVAASNNKDELPSWASYGPKTVDLAAPGTSIYSTLREGKYGYLSGGSMASPQVAGAAALILSVKPTFTTTELKADILNNVDKLPSFEGKVITGGRLDVCKAMPGCTEALPVNKTPPTITGSPEQGVSLTEVHGTWTPVPASYAYQWLQCNSSGASCAPISGATAQTYAPAAGDVGHTIKVEETAKDAGGSSSPAASIATAVVTPTFGKGSVGASQEALAANKKRVSRYALSTPGAVSKLNVYLAPTATSGSQLVKGVIYADTGTAPGALIAASEQLTFKSTETAGWYSLVFSSPVKLAAGNYWIGAMTGTAANVAAFRYSTVTNARDFNENTYTSGASNPFGTPTVDNKQTSLYAIYTPPPVNSTAPSITGTAQQGKELTEHNGEWTNNPTGFTYLWQQCDSSGANCTTISGATTQSYIPVAGDVGHTIRVQETASNSAGPSAPATSEPTAVVKQAVPVNTKLPTITGTPQQGEKLTEHNGEWTNSPTSFAYKWQQCNSSGTGCTTIAGATTQEYVPVAGDVGHTIRVVETASNESGPGTPATSEPTTVVGGVPTNTKLPTITGTAQQGKELTEHNGEWTNNPTGFTYLWQQCDSSGANCATISGATTQSYIPVAGDVGHTIRVQETASNSAGPSAPATSEPTAVVKQAVPVNTKLPTITGTRATGRKTDRAQRRMDQQPDGFTYKWQQCNSSGHRLHYDLGRHGPGHTCPWPETSGHTIRVEETASNESGPGTPATSEPTTVVGGRAHEHQTAHDHRHRPAGQRTDRAQRRMDQQPDRLHIPLAAVRQLRRQLHHDLRGHDAELHPGRRRRRPHDPRPGDGEQLGRPKRPGDVRTDRRGQTGSAREHETADDHGDTATGRKTDRAQRRMDQQPDELRL